MKILEISYNDVTIRIYRKPAFWAKLATLEFFFFFAFIARNVRVKKTREKFLGTSVTRWPRGEGLSPHYNLKKKREGNCEREKTWVYADVYMTRTS